MPIVDSSDQDVFCWRPLHCIGPNSGGLSTLTIRPVLRCMDRVGIRLRYNSAADFLLLFGLLVDAPKEVKLFLIFGHIVTWYELSSRCQASSPNPSQPLKKVSSTEIGIFHKIFHKRPRGHHNVCLPLFHFSPFQIGLHRKSGGNVGSVSWSVGIHYSPAIIRFIISESTKKFRKFPHHFVCDNRQT
jgi:hypothetical protein